MRCLNVELRWLLCHMRRDEYSGLTFGIVLFWTAGGCVAFGTARVFGWQALWSITPAWGHCHAQLRRVKIDELVAAGGSRISPHQSSHLVTFGMNTLLMFGSVLQFVLSAEQFTLSMNAPNHPAPGKAGIARLFAFVHRWPGLPEPGRSAKCVHL
jgi:hypothetical protein